MQDVMQGSTQKLAWEELCGFVNNIPAVVYSIAPLDKVTPVFVSKKIEQLTGYSSEELLSEPGLWEKLAVPEDREAVWGAYANCKRKCERFEIKYRILCKDNTTRHVLNKGEPVFNEKGEVVRIDGIISDISDRKRAEDELSRTQMLQSIGKLAAGIAHEINTPIQFIGDNLRFLCDSFGRLNKLLDVYTELCGGENCHCLPAEIVRKLSEAREDFELEYYQREIPQAIGQSLEGIKRVTTIVAAMRDFSRLDERRKVAADLNKAIESALVILWNEIKHVAEVKTNFDRTLPTIMCYLDDLNQVFLNLMINAGHAISDAIAAGKAAPGQITVTTKLEGDYAAIRISDTGTGIPEEIRGKIFEPFFTTKPAGKGTGQGLSIAWSIVVDKHGGTLGFETESGVGTTFIIRLPIVGESNKRDGK